MGCEEKLGPYTCERGSEAHGYHIIFEHGCYRGTPPYLDNVRIPYAIASDGSVRWQTPLPKVQMTDDIDTHIAKVIAQKLTAHEVKTQCYGCARHYDRAAPGGSFNFGAVGAHEVNFLCFDCATETKKFLLHLRSKSSWYSSEYD